MPSPIDYQSNLEQFVDNKVVGALLSTGQLPGNTKIDAKMLLEALKSGKILPDTKTHANITPLHLALLIKDVRLATEVINYLISNNANVNPYEDGETSVGPAIIMATARGEVELVKLLLKSQAGKDSIAINNKFGLTAVHVAARYGKSDIATLLLENNSEYQFHPDDKGLTELQHAKDAGSENIQSLIKEEHKKKADELRSLREKLQRAEAANAQQIQELDALRSTTAQQVIELGDLRSTNSQQAQELDSLRSTANPHLSAQPDGQAIQAAVKAQNSSWNVLKKEASWADLSGDEKFKQVMDNTKSLELGAKIEFFRELLNDENSTSMFGLTNKNKFLAAYKTEVLAKIKSNPNDKQTISELKNDPLVNRHRGGFFAAWGKTHTRKMLEQYENNMSKTRPK